MSMERLRQWTRRLRLLVHRRALEQAMDDELRHHIECEVGEHIRAGMSPEEARRVALAQFGGIEQVKEDARDARGTRPVEDLIADIGYGARVLRRSPGFTAATVLTFALATGAATAIFSVVYGVLLRPLPYADPDRLVVLWEHSPRTTARNVVSVGNFQAWRERSDAFDGMAALVPRPVTLTDAGPPERLAGAEVSPAYFRLLGVAPALGRDFEPDDESRADSRVVILSHGLWKRRFGADPAVVGSPLLLADGPYSVVGVMPAGFDPPQLGWLGEQELWFPFRATPENRAWGRFLIVVARLRTSVTLEHARAEMAVVADRLAHEVKADEGWTTTVIPLAAQITGDVRAALLVLQGAVGLLLVIAVTNVGTLSLSHTLRRAQELATRRALGATDRRLFRQLFTQSVLVGGLGAAVGGLAAWPMVKLLVWLAPDGVPRLDAIRVDTPVLLATLSVAVLATLVFGTIAARGKPDADSGGVLRSAGGRTTAGAGDAVLVVIEIAVALALGVMAALAARSFVSLRAVDLGFQADGVVAARVALSGEQASPARAHASFDVLLERVRALPGVVSAGLINTRPFGGAGPATEVTDLRPTKPGPAPITVADIRLADAAFFRALRIPAQRGSVFEPHEPSDGTPRVVISQSLQDTLWRGEDPVGRQFRLELYGGISADVIGVVPDLHLMDVRTPPRPTAYLAEARFPDGTRDLVVRFSGDPEALVPSLRTVLSTLEPGATLYRVTMLPDLVAASLARDRFTALLLSGFAGLAVLLSAVGVFGVISTETARRRKEIGIRMAVGAAPARLVWMLLGQALARASAGVAAGTALALSLAQLMKSLLFGVSPGDPASFLAVAAVVVVVVAVATLVPAIRGIRASPLAALREG
jgi:putative ABC transport system permease protein